MEFPHLQVSSCQIKWRAAFYTTKTFLISDTYCLLINSYWLRGLYYWTFKVLFLQPHVHGFINLVRFSGIIKLLTFFVACTKCSAFDLASDTKILSKNFRNYFLLLKNLTTFQKKSKDSASEFRRSWSDRKLNFLECEKNGKIRFNVRFELPPLQFFFWKKGKSFWNNGSPSGHFEFNGQFVK